MGIRNAKLRKLTLAALLAMEGCGGNGANTDVGESQAALVSGYNGGTPQVVTTEAQFPGLFQSETSLAISTYNGNTVRIVGYNAQDIDSYWHYDATSRYVYPYASIMGWSYRSAAAGSGWTAGNVYDMDAVGWTLLLGDPSVAAMPRTANAYLVNLASNKNFSVAIDPAQGGYPTTDDLHSGGCVARSTDQGQTFHTWKCLSNTTAKFDGAGYDGSSVVALSDSTGTKNQRIYVAFHNMSTFPYPIDVWYYNEASGDFGSTPLPNPFPGHTILSHPRLYSTNRYDKGLKVYLAAIDDNGSLLLVSHNGSTWGSPIVVATDAIADWNVYLHDGTSIKGDPGFGYAVGRAEYDNSIVEARFFYTARSGSRTILKGVRCLLSGTPTCTSPAAWSTAQTSAPSGQDFGPAVDAGFNSAGQWDWRVSYYTDNENVSTSQVKLYHGKPQATKVNTYYFGPRAVTGAQKPCTGSTVHYWGDYDDMRADPAGNGIYYRMMTDSTGSACDTSTAMRGAPQHVTEVTLPKL